MLRFRTAAKPTQAMYGMNKRPDSVDILLKLRAVKITASPSTTISANANAGSLIPKNITDHSAFKVSCIA